MSTSYFRDLQPGDVFRHMYGNNQLSELGPFVVLSCAPSNNTKGVISYMLLWPTGVITYGWVGEYSQVKIVNK